MALDPVLLTHLQNLAATTDADTIVHEALASLISHLAATIESYCGLRVTVADHEWPVTITAFAEDSPRPATSLRLPLRLISTLQAGGSRIVFYAARPGALVDLAADLSHALGVAAATSTSAHGGGAVASDGGGISVRLDGDLPPVSMASGIAGLEELSTINRAVGVLIGRGHRPEDAHDALRQAASVAGTDTLRFARQLLGR